MTNPAGKVYLAGAGPGHGARLLERADIVFYDALVHADTLALAQQAEKIPVGKRCGRRATTCC